MTTGTAARSCELSAAGQLVETVTERPIAREETAGRATHEGFWPEELAGELAECSPAEAEGPGAGGVGGGRRKGDLTEVGLLRV